jgi:carbonic anhydrase
MTTCRNAIALAAFAVVSAHAAEQQPHWSYKAHGGAANWAELDPAFTTCKLGHEQSPIDIRGAIKAKLPPIGFAYAAGPAEVVNNGHTIQVTTASGGSIKLPTGEYKLVQFHFHHPSEESVNGKRYPMVVHMVHQNDEGKLAVVALLVKEGKTNAALAPVFKAMPAKEGEKKPVADFDPAKLLPASQGYYAYVGSLTTPPCSEGVRWQVMKTPIEVSAAQLHAFSQRYSMNARPVQPLNGRTLEESE